MYRRNIYSKMLPICYICLRSDVKLRIIGNLYEDESELINFCDELCDYSFQDFFYQFCSNCINKLKNCLQFKNQCKLANGIIKSWKGTSESERISISEIYKEVPTLKYNLSVSNSSNLKVLNLTYQSTTEFNENCSEILSPHPHILIIDISDDNTAVKQEATRNDANKEIDMLNSETIDAEGKLKVDFGEYNNEISNDNEHDLFDEIELNGDETALTDDETGSVDDKLQKENKSNVTRPIQKVIAKKVKSKPIKSHKESNLDTDSESETLDKLKVKIKRRKDKKKNKRFELEITTEDEFKDILIRKLKESGVDKDDKGNNIDVNNITNRMDKLPYYYLRTIEDVLAAGPGALPSPVLQKVLEMNGHLSVFDIENLSDQSQIEAEFSKRSQYPDYLNSQYRCEDCIVGYFNQKILDFHRKVKHDPSLPFCCELCKMRFKNRRYLVLHKTLQHSVVYRCKRCPYIVTHRIGMDNHYRKHEGIKFTCELCPDSKFTRSNQLYIHMNRYHNKDKKRDPLYCEYCRFITYHASGLQLHRKRAHGADKGIKLENAKQCSECNALFANDDIYNKHVQTKHKKKVLYQTLQLKRYKPRENKTRRIGPRKLATCQLCRAQFTNHVWLSRHVREQHPTENAQEAFKTRKHYLCHECGVTFPDIIRLGDHLNVHSGLKPYACSQCDKTFHSRHNLYTHAKRHLPPLPCDICGKEFKSKPNLYNHQLTHKGDKCYKCEICGKMFLTRTLLNEHVRGVHLNIRRKRKRGEASAEAMGNEC